MHVVDTRGRVHSAGDAVIQLMLQKRTTWLPGQLARLLPPARHLVDRWYERRASRRDVLAATVADVEPTVVRPRWIRFDG
jgi:predicted DCC family thiol-disulfide oxidoreductase YuxK